jgi:hypothetical protein
MAIDAKPGQTVRVTITKRITRAGAHKTLERLFMKDKAISKPIATRSRNFITLPKRRGGQIWVKWPNKVHPTLEAASPKTKTAPAKPGVAANVKVTASSLKDLNSVAEFIEVSAV